jgi:hypothetical protein
MNRTIERDNIRPPPHYREDGPPQIITSDTARGGPLGMPVLVVLLSSLTAAAIACVAVAAIYAHG